MRHAALGLSRAGLLDEFWTCLNLRTPSLLKRILPGSVTSQLRRRSYPVELEQLIRTQPFREIVRLIAPHVGLEGLMKRESDPFSVDSVYRSLDRAVARRLRNGKFRAVYAYEDGAALSFREAQRQGVKTFYDLPIGYWKSARKLMQEEAQREPEWASTLSGNDDSPEKTDRKDAELALADVVFVASTFTRTTLDAAESFKGTVVTIPYGSPGRPTKVEPRRRAPGARLRVLFVGSLGQRKGLSYLFAACGQLRSAVDLTVIGRKPFDDCPALDRELAHVTWRSSCTHEEVLAEMAASDVFLFPSLFEGFGLVLLEALAMGLPIITTPNTAGPDLITDGVEGYIVPIRDSRMIAERLEQLHRDPSLLAEISVRARRRSGELTWESYEATLVACTRHALQPT